MTFKIEVSEAWARYIEKQAAKHNMTPEEFAVQIVEAMFSEAGEPENDIIAEHLLEKN